MSVYKNMPQNRWGADTFLHSRGRPVDSRRLGYATTLERLGGGEFAIRHHWTAIVVFHPDDSVTVDPNGWRSPTTKARINAALRRSGWSVGSYRGGWHWFLNGEHVCEFEDGDRVFLFPGFVGQAGIFEGYLPSYPDCGHSACRQNWIDTAESECVR